MDTADMRIVYFGSDHFSATVLRALIEQEAGGIVEVITTPPQKAGRGLTVRPNPVAVLCAEKNIACSMPEQLDDPVSARLAALGPDLFVVVSYGKILPGSLLTVPRRMAINLHPSLLPRWRGPSPMPFTLLSGDTEGGVSIITVAEKVDAGALIAQESFPVPPDMDSVTLEQKVLACGIPLLCTAIRTIAEGTAALRVQDESAVTYARKLRKNDGLIDWQRPATEIHNQIRALCEWPGAYTFLQGIRVKVLASSLAGEERPGAAAGTIVDIDKKGSMAVATGSGVIVLREVQAAGKKRMNAFDFSLGARIKNGDRFEVPSG